MPAGHIILGLALLLAAALPGPEPATVNTPGATPPAASTADTGRPANDSDCFSNLTFRRRPQNVRHKHHAWRLFARRNIWNTPIRRRARLDRNSGLMASQLLAEVRDQFVRGVGPWLDRGAYSSPLYRVGAHQPRVRVQLDYAQNPCRFSLVRAFASVPLPPDAQPASGTDRHLTLWQPSSDKMWEFWHLRLEPDGWHAGFGGAMMNVSRSPGRYTAGSWRGVHTDWGATASGLPVIGGSITPKEFRTHRIPHALALNLPQTRAGTAAFPALKTDGKGEGAGYIPEGARLRLDPDLDVSQLAAPPLVKALARAAQRYGIYVRDRTANGAMFFARDVSQAHPGAYQGLNDPLEGQLPHKVLIQFPWDRLQVMRIRPRRPAHSTYPTRTITPDGLRAPR